MNKTKPLKSTLIIICSMVAIALLTVVIAIVLAVVMKKNENNDSGAQKGDVLKIQSFSNQGNTYTLNLDSYVTFSDFTSHSTVNNEDGLEVKYSNTYITIQRFSASSFHDDFESFLKFIEENTSMGNMNVKDCDLTIENDAVTDYEASYVSQSGFTGYLIYMRTGNGMYKLLISGSDEDIVEHYKTFVNDMEFR